MGKRLIIKGADFSLNGIEFNVFGVVVNYVLDITKERGGHAITYDSNAQNKKRLSAYESMDKSNCYGVLIKNGESITIRGLKGKSGNSESLMVDYAYFSSPKIPIIYSQVSEPNPNLIGTASNFVSSNYFPLNKEGHDELTIVNSFGNDYYFAFSFKGENEGVVDANDYELEYKMS